MLQQPVCADLESMSLQEKDLPAGGGAAPPRAEGGLRVEGRLLVFVTIVLSALTLRLGVTSLTPLLGELKSQLGFSATMTGVFGMAPVAMFGLAGLAAPLLVPKVGLERLALFGAVLTTAGLVGRGFGFGPWDELGWYSLGLAGMGVGNVVTPPLVKRYFPDRIAVVSTWYTFAVQLGTVLPPMISVQLAQAHGWRVSLAAWALCPLCVAPLFAFLTIRRGAAGRSSEQPACDRVPLAALVRSQRAWGMTFLFGMTSLITYTLLTWLPERLAAVGVPAKESALMLTLYAAVGFVGPLVAVPLLSRLPNPFVLVLVSATCHLIGLAGLLLSPGSGVVVWTIFVGLGPLTFAMALTLIGVSTRTSEHAAALSGFAQGGGYLLAMTGPLLFGVLHELTAAWTASFAVLGAAVLLTLAGGWHASRPGKLEDELALS